MKVRQILYSICLIALMLPVVATAQIYKWKDKNGVMRYSDMPPPPDVQVMTIGKSDKDAYPEPAPANVPEAADSVQTTKPAAPIKVKDPVPDPELEAKREQARKAEFDRQKKQEQEKQAKLAVENCQAAKANYQTYLQGGRVYEINDKGERVYLGDDDLAAGKAQAQAEINRYCK